jgi:hypothetical protein
MTQSRQYYYLFQPISNFQLMIRLRRTQTSTRTFFTLNNLSRLGLLFTSRIARKIKKQLRLLSIAQIRQFNHLKYKQHTKLQNFFGSYSPEKNSITRGLTVKWRTLYLALARIDSLTTNKTSSIFLVQIKPRNQP